MKFHDLSFFQQDKKIIRHIHVIHNFVNHFAKFPGVWRLSAGFTFNALII